MIHTPQRISPIESSFDPFVDLLQAQEEQPHHLHRVDLRSLTAFQRSLLAIDGTVTKFIEAYTLEPIQVQKISQEPQTLDTAHVWLEAPKGTEVVARQVLLRGNYTSTVYAYAISLLVLDFLPQNLVRQLAQEPGGIGRVLLNSHIENRREILWYGREQLPDLPEQIQRHTGNDFLSRTYRVITADRPVMLINEKFPLHVRGSENDHGKTNS